MALINIKFPRIRKVATWKTLLYLTILCLITYFVAHERSDFYKIKIELGKANQLWIYIGFATAFLYVFFQASLYYFSFKTINKRITFSSSVFLFLKRNFLSVFLPAGGVSSLVFFNKEIEKQDISKTQIYLASSIYAFCGMFSVLLIAIPTFVYLLIFRSISENELVGLGILILITAIVAFLIYSFVKGTFVHRMVEKYIPQVLTITQELRAQKFKIKNLIAAIIMSFMVDFSSILFILIAMLSLGMSFSLEIA